MKKKYQWSYRDFLAGMLILFVAVFAWLARNVLSGAWVFFTVGLAYAFGLYRIVSLSDRAFLAMSWAMITLFGMLFSLEDDLGIPAGAPAIAGVIVGAILGGYVWFGPRAGTELKRKRERTPDGQFTGGWRLAVINAVCAALLLGVGIAHIAHHSLTATVAAVFLIAFAGGWALFRFPLPLQVRNLLILVVPLGTLVFAAVGGATNQLALWSAWVFGVLPGILLGGRYWSGPRFGAPRPPFNGTGARRRKRKRRPRAAKPKAAPAK